MVEVRQCRLSNEVDLMQTKRISQGGGNAVCDKEDIDLKRKEFLSTVPLLSLHYTKTFISAPLKP